MRDISELSLYEKLSVLLAATAIVIAVVTTTAIAGSVCGSFIKDGSLWDERVPFDLIIRAYVVSAVLFSIALLMHWDRLWLFIRYHIGKRL